ncbi:hypothetical protein DsansV1_C17g0144521 [Dioscorea sansibarensis]
MAIEMKKVLLFTRKGLMLSIRTSYKFTKDYPFVSGLVFFMLSLYRCFPSLFAFLISSSPVIFCTAVLLGLLLSYGEPNIPEVEEEEEDGEKTQEVCSLKATSVADNLVVKNDEIFEVETHVEQRREIDEVPTEATPLIGGDINTSNNIENYAYSLISHDERKRNDGPLTASSPAFKENEKEIHSEEKVDKDVSHALNDVQREFEAPGVEMADSALGDHFTSSLGSQWQHIERHDTSLDSESDGAESSSPDASMADILPMLDELHPLLYSEHPQNAHKDNDNSDAASRSSSEDNESVDSQAEEEAAKNRGLAEDEEGQEERDDGTEVAVKWTADDQKNIMDLGILELERNQRLENLIAKRRARKRLEAERNIDPFMLQFRGLHIETQPASATRRNPFDLPDDSEESMGLPPIPGSAPSVLLPRWNPFDFADDPIGETGGLTGEKMSQHKEFEPQRGLFFQKHNSFSVEPLFSGGITQERRASRFRPAESMDSDSSDYAAFPGQISAISDSAKESEWSDPVNRKTGTADLGHQPSEKLGPIDVKQPGASHMVEDNGIGFSTAGATEGTHPVVDDFGTDKEEIKHDEELSSPVAKAHHLDEIKEKFNDSSSSSSSSSSSDVADKDLEMSIGEVSATAEQGRIDSSNNSRDSTESDILDYDNVSNKADCISGSIPLATEESPYNVAALDRELFLGGKEGSYSSSLASDLRVEVSEVGSPPRPNEMNVTTGDGAFVFNNRSRGEDLTSGTQDLSVASSSFSFTEANESISREVSLIEEHDVIKMVYPEAETDFSESVISGVPEPATVQHIHHSNLSSVVNDSNDMEASLARPVNESMRCSTSKEHENLRNPTERVDFEEFQPSVLDLPPIPENPQESVLEHEHGSSGESISTAADQSETGNDSDIKCDSGSICSDMDFGEVHNETKDFKEIDELLLSELDVVGDFRAVKPASDQGLSGIELPSVLEPPAETVDKMEQTVYKPKLHVLDAFHHEGIGLVSDELVEGADPPLAAESMVEKHTATDVEVGSSGLDGFDKDQEPAGKNSKLLVLEAKSIDDINLAFNQLSQSDLVNLVQDKAGPSEILPFKSHTELIDVHSDMQLVEARSLDDIHLAMNLLSSAVVDNSNKSVENEDESSEVIDSELVETHSELQFVEATTLEDIQLAMKQLSKATVIDQNKTIEDVDESSVAESSQMHPDSELLALEEKSSELLETHSELQVVEASTIEEIQLAMKQLLNDTVNDQNKSSEGADESSVAESSQTHPESELLVLEAKSIEDIFSAFKQLHGGDYSDKSVYSEVGPSEAMETHSDLQVIEAKSLDDSHVVLRRQFDGAIGHPSIPVESQNRSTEILEAQPIQEIEDGSETEQQTKISTEV